MKTLTNKPDHTVNVWIKFRPEHTQANLISRNGIYTKWDAYKHERRKKQLIERWKKYIDKLWQAEKIYQARIYVEIVRT